MEVIELSSYTEEEKRQIALHHLLPKQMKSMDWKRDSWCFLKRCLEK